MSINNKDNYYIFYSGASVVCVINKTKLQYNTRWHLLQKAGELNLIEDDFYKQKFHAYRISGEMKKKLDEIGVTI